MPDKYVPLRQAIQNSIKSLGRPGFDEVLNVMEGTLKALCKDGLVVLGPDYTLRNQALEFRVKEIFQGMDFDIRPGRPKLEDFVVNTPASCPRSDPLVVEVKGSIRPNVGREDLRQLDDWVFDLSGEEKVRKRKRPRPNTFYITAGLPKGPSRHPSPHKGVMIFNGPVERPFSKRSATCLNPNDLEFVQKRNFCIVPFAVLGSYFQSYYRDSSLALGLWTQMQEMAGVLPSPTGTL